MPKKPSRTMSGTSLSKLTKQTRILPGSPLGHHHHFHRGRASTCFALPALLSRVLDGDWSAASFFLWTEYGVLGLGIILPASIETVIQSLISNRVIQSSSHPKFVCLWESLRASPFNCSSGKRLHGLNTAQQKAIAFYAF